MNTLNDNNLQLAQFVKMFCFIVMFLANVMHIYAFIPLHCMIQKFHLLS